MKDIAKQVYGGVIDEEIYQLELVTRELRKQVKTQFCAINTEFSLLIHGGSVYQELRILRYENDRNLLEIKELTLTKYRKLRAKHFSPEDN